MSYCSVAGAGAGGAAPPHSGSPLLLVSPPGLLLPEAIVQITQPLSRAALSEGGVTTVAGTAAADTVASSCGTLRTAPAARQHAVTLSRHPGPGPASPLLEAEDGDYITLTASSSVASLSVFSSQAQDREVPLDSITLDSVRGLGSEDEGEASVATARVILAPSQPRYPASSPGYPAPGQQLVTISQASISLPLDQFPGAGAEYAVTSEPLPGLMSPPCSAALLSPPMTRDQMMSSTIMPRDQMLSSHVNQIPKLLPISSEKDQNMSSSRGEQLIFDYLSILDI